MENWYHSKNTKGIDVYYKKINTPNVCFRTATDFDFPPAVVLEYCRDIPKRMLWDDGYEFLKFVKHYSMNTLILQVVLKPQWPLGNRDCLLIFQGIVHEDGSIYLGS